MIDIVQSKRKECGKGSREIESLPSPVKLENEFDDEDESEPGSVHTPTPKHSPDAINVNVRIKLVNREHATSFIGRQGADWIVLRRILLVRFEFCKFSFKSVRYSVISVGAVLYK